jgi:predicted MFS family arabinose efflux permease
VSRGHALPKSPSTTGAALILFGILFLGVSDNQLIPPLLPQMARELGIAPGRAGLLVTVYALAAAAFALASGAASDRLGRKRLITSALVVFGLASLLTSQSTHFSILLIGRLLTGFAAGTLSTLSLSYAADLFPYERRGRAMGILSMAYFLAFVIGLPVGSAVAGSFGWPWVFRGLAMLTACMLLISVLSLPEDRARRPLALLPTVSAFFHVPERLAGIGAAFLTSGGLVGFITYVGVWLDAQDVSVERIGLLLMVAGIGATVASPLSGWLADHIGKRNVVIGANILLAPLFVATSHAGWGPGLFLAVLVLAMLAGARQGPLHALTTELVSEAERGSYVAVRNAASQLGIATIAGAAALAFDRAGFTASAWISAAATLLLVPVCLAIREPTRR